MSSEKIIIGKSLMNIHEINKDDITRSIIMILRDRTPSGYEYVRDFKSIPPPPLTTQKRCLIKVDMN